MKINILSLAIYAAVLLSPAHPVTAQTCSPVSNLTAQRSAQAAALNWQVAQPADAILCYRWTMQQHGWRYDWQLLLPGGATSYVDSTLGPSKTYEYAIALHYPDCGWTAWQYVVVGPYSSTSTSPQSPGKTP